MADKQHSTDHHRGNGVFAGSPVESLARLIPVRQVSPTGAELVDLSVLVDGRYAATLTVAHLWHSAGTQRAGLYAVVSPGRLNGTVVFFNERAFDANQVIVVRVKGARGDRVLSTDQVEDHILASDFTYDDLRFFTPRPVLYASTIEPADSDDATSFSLSSTYSWRSTLIHARAQVAGDGLVTSIDWTRASDGVLVRQLSLSNLFEVAGHRIPRRIRVVRPQDSYASELTLRSVRCDFPNQDFGDIFERDLGTVCDQLPEVLDRIFGNVSPGSAKQNEAL